MKLGIGTAQFGLDYGISNTQGKTPPEEVKTILQVAAKRGIHYLDTAARYGESELVLGQQLPDPNDYCIITKFSDFTTTRSEIQSNVEQMLEAALERLQQKTLYAILLHHPDDLFSTNGDLIVSALEAIKHSGVVEKIGISVYSPEQALEAIERMPVDLVQCPINVFDQRALENNFLNELTTHGIEIHVRSAFLQGLLLLPQDRLPTYFSPFEKPFSKFHRLLSETGYTALQVLLKFVMNIPQVDTVICGVNNHLQLNELCDIADLDLDTTPFEQCRVSDSALINPSRWVL